MNGKQIIIDKNEAKGTAEICRFFNNLFDSVNGSDENDVYELRRPVTENSAHHKFWDEALTFLKSIRFLDNENDQPTSVPSLKNWITTVEGFKLLWKKVHNLGFTELKTKYVNQDPLENFFGQIRSHTVTNRNPTPAQFESSFKSLFISIVKPKKIENSNCEIGEEPMLFTLLEFIPDDETDTALDLINNTNSSNCDNVLSENLCDIYITFM